MARPRIPEEKRFVVLSIRLPRETIAAIDAYASLIHHHFGAVRAARSRAARALIQRGLATVSALGNGESPGETPDAGRTTNGTTPAGNTLASNP